MANSQHSRQSPLDDEQVQAQSRHMNTDVQRFSANRAPSEKQVLAFISRAIEIAPANSLRLAGGH